MRFSITKTLLLAFILTVFIKSAHANDIIVIVNAESPFTSITVDELNAYFMKKDRTWPNGNAVRFFDHRDDNDNRKVFLKKFIKKNSREIELYWIGEKIYTGNIAPIQITSDSMMTAMVSRFPGGIGYVSTKYKLPKTVRRITIKKE